MDINHVLWSLLQDTLLLESAREGNLEGVKESLSKQANINIGDEVYNNYVNIPIIYRKTSNNSEN